MYFLIAILSFLILPAASVSAQKIAVSATDSVRVWVFEDRSFSTMHVFVYDGNATVFTDGDSTRFMEKGSNPVIFERKSGKIHVRDTDLYASSVRILAHDRSLIRIVYGNESRIVRGVVHIDLKGRTAGLRVINKVSLEDYVTSVIAGEMPFEESEALKSQAVIARTYALWNMAMARRTDFDVTDHTASQVYIGEPVTKPFVRFAAEATRGEVLTWSGKLILSAYFSTSGGTTTSNETVWKGKPLPYLRPIDDGDASRESPHYAWNFAVSEDRFYASFRAAFPRKEVSIRILEKDESGRVTKMQLGSRNLSGQEFRLEMISHFGAKSLKSTFFDVTKTADSVVFSGHGMGHGVGLSQWGAYGLARSGWSYVEILKFYYSGVEVSNIHYFESAFIELAN